MPRAEIATCPVCNWFLQNLPRSDGGGTNFDCDRCGTFAFSREANEDMPSVRLTDKQRAILSHSIRRAQRNGRTPQYDYAQIMLILELAYLPGAYEQADNLIRWLGDTIDGPGETVGLNRRDHGAIAGSLLSFESFDYLIEAMFKSEMLEGRFGPWTFKNPNGRDTSQSDGLAQVTLSFAGWGRYEELKRGSVSGNIAFMAMQYRDTELDSIVNDHFRPAVSETGFSLRRLDDQPRAGLIDDRLRVEIKACRFLIADLSHGNRGAHWEAGYAEGLGKEVIYTCREDVFNDSSHQHHPHFDTNHHLTVVWDPANIEDACRRLKETIRATMPDAQRQD